MTAWWTETTGTILSAYGGAGVGIIGGLFGTAVGVLAPRGVGRQVITAAQYALTAVGVVVLGLGLTGLVTGQPYHVWYPPTLVGGVMAAVIGGLIPAVRQRYREAEQRKLEAESIRRA